MGLIRLVASEHGIEVKTEDAQLEKSLSVAAEVAKTSEASGEQLDLAAKLLTVVTELGKKVAKIGTLLEQNTDSGLDVDAHVSFASACSKLQVQLRTTSAFSASLHQIFEHDNPDALNVASKKLVGAVVSAVGMQIDNNLLQVPNIINEYLEIGGTLPTLLSSHAKVADCIKMFGDQSSLRANCSWLLQLRPLHILKLLGKVSHFLSTHKADTSAWFEQEWKHLRHRFNNAVATAARDAIRGRLFQYDALSDNVERAEMWSKYMCRFAELENRDFKVRSEEDWTAFKQAKKNEFDSKNVTALKALAKDGVKDATNISVVLKGQLVALLVQLAVKDTEEAENELKEKWVCVADEVKKLAS